MNKNNDLDLQKLSHQLISNLTFCVFDLETTGGNQKHDKIIEIGLVKITNLKITEKLNFLINPKIAIPDFIKRLTHIKNTDVKNKPTLDKKIDEVLEFMGDSILVAHNTSFDIPFLNSELRRLNREELTNKSICTNLMTKYLIPNLLNSNLTYMSKIFGIKLTKAHRASDDAQAAAELLIKYLNIFISKKITKINHLYYPRNRYELDRTHFRSDHHTNKHVLDHLNHNQYNCLLTIKGQNGVIIFSIPIHKNNIDDFITDKIKSSDWKTITIKIYGHTLEAALNFGQFFIKFSLEEKQEISNNLNSYLLENYKLDFDIEDEQELFKELNDFVIIPHLIPEQFLVISTDNLNLKNSLIFRFPAHKKRFIQFITNRSIRFNTIKNKSPNLHPIYKETIYKLIKKHTLEGTLFTFKKKDPINNPDDFLKKLEEYTSKNEKSNNYPENYI